PDPIPDAWILDVLELRADRIGIDIFEKRDHVAQRHLAPIKKEFRRNDEIAVFLAEAELAQTEQRIFRPLVRQRIEARDGVAEGSVRVNKSVHASRERLVAYLAERRCRDCRRAIAQLQIAQ